MWCWCTGAGLLRVNCLHRLRLLCSGSWPATCGLVTVDVVCLGVIDRQRWREIFDVGWVIMKEIGRSHSLAQNDISVSILPVEFLTQKVVLYDHSILCFFIATFFISMNGNKP